MCAFVCARPVAALPAKPPDAHNHNTTTPFVPVHQTFNVRVAAFTHQRPCPSPVPLGLTPSPTHVAAATTATVAHALFPSAVSVALAWKPDPLLGSRWASGFVPLFFAPCSGALLLWGARHCVPACLCVPVCACVCLCVHVHACACLCVLAPVYFAWAESWN